jgi:hypothetical protein
MRERHTNLHGIRFYDSTAVGFGSKREAFAQEGMMGDPPAPVCDQTEHEGGKGQKPAASVSPESPRSSAWFDSRRLARLRES